MQTSWENGSRRSCSGGRIIYISRPDNDVTGVTNDGNIVASPPPLTTPAVSKKSHPWNTDLELENSELDLSVFNSARGEEQIRSEKSRSAPPSER